MVNKKNILLPCLRGIMGDWVYYSTLLNANQIKDLVLTSKDIRENESLDDYLQRDLNTNLKRLMQYINSSEHRFFNSIIIGVFDGIPDWHPFELQNLEQHVNVPVSDDISSNLSGAMGILQLSGNEKMFAIDGQHRVEAVKQILKQNQSNKKTLEDNDILKDYFSAILVAHLDDERGKQRTRKLFFDINQKAVKVTEGELVIIDEENPTSIVARRLYAEYAPFQEGRIILLSKTSNMPSEDETHFTNLLSLSKINKTLKAFVKNYKDFKKSEQKLNEVSSLLYDETILFWDLIIQSVDDYRQYFNHQKELSEFRKRKNVLFRPIGLELLVGVYKHLKENNEIDKIKLMNQIDFNLPGDFENVLWRQGTRQGTIETAALNKKVALDIILYKINALDEKRKLDFQENYQKLLGRDKSITKIEQLST